MVQAILPDAAQSWVRDAVYRRNCRLDPRHYRAALERWYRLSTGQTCDLDHPQTFTEKAQWLKLYDSTPIKGRLADKYLMREFVAQQIGEEYLVPLVGVWDSADDIDFDALPDRYVLKATHGSRWNLVVPEGRALNVASARRQLTDWLGRRMAMTGGFELHYEFCEPRIVCEQFLQDDSGGLRDYKFMAFNGQVQFAITVDGRFTEERMVTVLPDWSRAPFRYNAHYDRGEDAAADLSRPQHLEEMLEITTQLARDFALARVDFYEVAGRVYVGEITFTSSNGLPRFAPAHYDAVVGSQLSLPDKKPFKGVML
ncbi:ATP-grasp fold amidoligase family protein [Actinomyces sp. MRS3W]|uniref:ATP-grasp fold amidoligase family protein n=1 Tax=Actinomyces sp. MRS3W TaxID=2800796 RepID=UPI0028FD788A|nr:ATP-grasp fold amidoligase family protein [Actinomyces sp. MRS3W]MDU0349606.1 ATP-grasp fold amidoligase family protein [Actinomyces sp. MRS3W]